MLCLIYRFQVRPGVSDRFREEWSWLTSKLIEENGSLGARLHHVDETTLIAYAQWPDLESWRRGERAISELFRHERLGDYLVKHELLYEMTLVEDLLTRSSM